MRIYNKKTFGFGIFALALGLLNIVAGVMTGFDGKGVFLIVLLFLIGAGSWPAASPRKCPGRTSWRSGTSGISSST